jgi:gluconate 2-dehydrogenase gamma chain
MAESNKFTRRSFVKIAAAGAGSIYLLPRCSSGQVSGWRFFTDAEAVLVDAVADQIIPPDEWQGGKESGATNFIDKQLVGPYRRYRETYRKGLATMQDSCNTLYQKRFEELSREEQTAFLEKMESGLLKEKGWTDGSDSEFFALIRDHIMQSYYGNPRHGGNRNNQSYRMIGLDYPIIIGQNRYKV